MTSREAFQFGFLAYCADRGMAPEETRSLVKKAMDKKAIPLAWLAAAPAALWSGLGPYALAAAIGVPVAAGLGGGYLAAKATEKDVDPEEFQGDEVIEQYRRATEQARRQALLKKIRGLPTLAQGAV